MKKLMLLFSCCFCIGGFTKAQFNLYQYFDGADTSEWTSLFIELDTTAGNVWQIGGPDKIIFNGAATVPNVIVTDTLNYAPANNLSRFSFKIIDMWQWTGIMAMQWKQKLDLVDGHSWGIVEYSVDMGNSWENAYDNPYIYNFYGYDSVNVDTASNGEYAFTGTDSAWRDIWLCFDISYFYQYDTVLMRFTYQSDSLGGGKEGWMIDNMSTHLTTLHTAGNDLQMEYMKVYPTVTSGQIFLEGQKIPDIHMIESIELMTIEGKIVQRFGQSPVKFNINIDSHQNGMYFLRIKTNFRTVTVPVILNKNAR